ncbi:MAG: cytochrome b N-terminal domain-containing protein [Kastovskya adunca ATA6-11-RM4]|jgi:cytochrome b6|nr:cytochrome b N-terminal domain-containing protein [Kastovskya adunca ATA6-11-RM4]
MNSARYRFILQRLATILSVSILALSVTAGVTGILIAFFYEPTAGGAYESLRRISEEIPSGGLIRDVHNIAGNWVIGIALIQMVVMFLGRQFRTSWLIAWISGIVLILNAIALGWTAMLLSWTQEGYWRLKIELGTIEELPVIGNQLRDILTGGGGVGTTSVEHFYTLHSYILSVGAIALAIIHLGGLVLQETAAKRLQSNLAAILAASESLDQQNATSTDRNFTGSKTH